MLFCLEGCCGERRPLETERFQKRRIFLDRVGLIENNSMRKLEGFVHLIGSGSRSRCLLSYAQVYRFLEDLTAPT